MRTSWYICAAAALALEGCAGAPLATVANIGDVPPSEIQAPGADVPTAMRAYSGVWVGKWDGVWSAAIIVRKIDRDGGADIAYRWQRFPDRPWTEEKTFVGSFYRGTLYFGGAWIRIDPTNPTTARGEAASVTLGLRHMGEFKKVG